MEPPVKVIVDSREPESILGILRERQVVAERSLLRVGDYVLSPECAIERKTVQDFMQSIFDGRLFEQAWALRDAYTNPILILEGDLSAGLSTMRNPGSFWGALLMLEMDVGLRVVPTPSPAHTVDAICALARRLPKGPTGRGPFPGSANQKPRLQTDEGAQLYVVAGLPGIGPKLAKRLLARFGSVRNVFQAIEPSLAEVEGIGPSKAAKINQLLDRQFSE